MPVYYAINIMVVLYIELYESLCRTLQVTNLNIYVRILCMHRPK